MSLDNYKNNRDVEISPKDLVEESEPNTLENVYETSLKEKGYGKQEDKEYE